MGAASRRMRAWPRMSSGLVGSSIHQGLSGASARVRSMASSTPHFWLASTISLLVRADLLAHDAAAAQVVGGLAADLELEVGPAFGERLAAEAADLFVASSRTSRRRWCRRGSRRLRAGAAAAGMRGLAGGEDVEGFIRGEGVVDVAEVDERDELLGRHVGEQLPERVCLRPWRRGPRRR